MNKEDFYHLIGTYLNGYKIVKVEDDPFIKGQINLCTDEVKSDYFGGRNIVKFFIRTDSDSSKIYQELIDKEIFKLKDNWNKLKSILNEQIKINNDIHREIIGEEVDLINKTYEYVLFKMQELEKGE